MGKTNEREIDTAEWAQKVQSDARVAVLGGATGSLGCVVETRAPKGFELDSKTALAAKLEAWKNERIVPM